MAGNKTESKNNKQGKEFYKKYRWFFTSSGKLVYGGKSAEQNEEIVHNLITNKNLKKESENFFISHTKIPGSPFGVIFASPESVNENDLEETAVWTGCFSRAWRHGLKNVEVDIFRKSDIYKRKSMSIGTFGIKKKIERKKVKLNLVLINQKNILRAVPEKTPKKNQKIFSKIIPGDIKKDKFAEILSERINKEKPEILNALPTGSFKEKN